MKLKHVISNLDSFDENSIVYAQADPRWTPESAAIVVPIPDNPDQLVQPTEPPGMRYLLEVFIAKEVLEDRRRQIGRDLEPDEMYAYVVSYAENDA